MSDRATDRIGAFFGIPAQHVPAAAAYVAVLLVVFLVSGSLLATLYVSVVVLVVTGVIRWEQGRRRGP